MNHPQQKTQKNTNIAEFSYFTEGVFGFPVANPQVCLVEISRSYNLSQVPRIGGMTCFWLAFPYFMEVSTKCVKRGQKTKPQNYPKGLITPYKAKRED